MQATNRTKKGSTMKDLMNMMGKVKEMQAKMEAMQTEIEELTVDGSAGAGLVTVTLSGKGEMRGVTIDPSLLKDSESEILEDLIMAAHNDAKEKSPSMVAEKSAEVTAGLPIPPGMKLPF